MLPHHNCYDYSPHTERKDYSCRGAFNFLYTPPGADDVPVNSEYDR